jgi:hypothetical protein
MSCDHSRRLAQLPPILLSGAMMALTTACLSDSPDTNVVDGDENCEGTQPGNACLMLHFFATASVRDDPPGEGHGIGHRS